MAAGTATILGGAGALLGGIQAIGGAKRVREANSELNDYDRQVLDNAFENIQINTAGADLLREQGAQATANMVDAVQNGGSRSVIGGLPKVAAYSNEIDQKAARLLDDQYARRDYAAANDNARIEAITENRDNANINALSSQANAGRQDMWSGILGAASGLAYGARNMTPGVNPEVSTLDTTGAPGLTPIPAQPISATPIGGTYTNLNNPVNHYGSQGPSPYNPFAGFPPYFNTGS